MARIFITGSSDGLGQLAAAKLIHEGHQVVLHARNQDRAQEAIAKMPGAETVLVADLSDVEATIQLAHDANASGTFDAVIHNAGVYKTEGDKIANVNSLAPYILTSIIQQPARLIYISSGMHLQGIPNLRNLEHSPDRISYSDSKLHNVILCMAVARKWQEVVATAVDPGWVPTKMGGRHATDNLEKGFETQTWLAVSDDSEAKLSGSYFYHRKQKRYAQDADDLDLQEQFLSVCEKTTKISFPGI